MRGSGILTRMQPRCGTRGVWEAGEKAYLMRIYRETMSTNCTMVYARQTNSYAHCCIHTYVPSYTYTLLWQSTSSSFTAVSEFNWIHERNVDRVCIVRILTCYVFIFQWYTVIRSRFITAEIFIYLQVSRSKNCFMISNVWRVISTYVN